MIQDHGKATIENNDISNHSEPNLEIWGGAEAMTVRNNIHGSQQSGIFVHSKVLR